MELVKAEGRRMREILFRGKRTDISLWAVGDLVRTHPCECHIVTADLDDYNEIEITSDHYVDYKTVGQFTGVTDKNGKKIFEGDIVRFDNGVFVVAFYESRMGFGFSGLFGRGCVPGFTMTCWEHIEIIGNIYDNPELLEAQE